LNHPSIFVLSWDSVRGFKTERPSGLEAELGIVIWMTEHEH